MSDDKGRRRVLVVDDDKMVCRALARALSRDYEVDAVDSAEGALDLLAQAEYDVVVSDYAMPVRDGVSLLREVQTGWPIARRILISGEESSQFTEVVESGLAQLFLRKPIMPKEIISAVSRVLKQPDPT